MRLICYISCVLEEQHSQVVAVGDAVAWRASPRLLSPDAVTGAVPTLASSRPGMSSLSACLLLYERKQWTACRQPPASLSAPVFQENKQKTQTDLEPVPDNVVQMLARHDAVVCLSVFAHPYLLISSLRHVKPAFLERTRQLDYPIPPR